MPSFNVLNTDKPILVCTKCEQMGYMPVPFSHKDVYGRNCDGQEFYKFDMCGIEWLEKKSDLA